MRMGTYGPFPGAFWELHQFSVDSERNLYGADGFNGRTQESTPKRGAARSQTIAAPPPLMSKVSQ